MAQVTTPLLASVPRCSSSVADAGRCSLIGDGGSTSWKQLNVTGDNIIQQKRVPPMIAIHIGNGGQDAQGAQRGRDYATVSGIYAQFVEREILPLVEQRAGVKLTKIPSMRRRWD